MTKHPQEDVVEKIIIALDQLRVAMDGGYPSEWIIEQGTVYCATVDHDGGPSLIALPAARFIDEYGWILDEEEDIDPI